MRVLLADDSGLARRRLTELLGGWGYEVVACQDGTEAWRALQEDDAPPLAVLDWSMPGLNGVELCRLIRRQAREPYTYVILLTAIDRKDGVVEGLAAGADDYLKKPFDEEELEVRLRAGARIIDLQKELVEARETLREQATHDALTGLWNRAAILEHFRRELLRARRERAPLAVVLVDLDHFKEVNDTLGHLRGDEVLVEASRRLLTGIRDYDMAGRYGGEEFLVLLPRCDRVTICRRAEELRSAIGGEPMAIAGEVRRLTASLGAVIAEPGNAASVEDLLMAADQALYRAKDAGRDRVELAETPRRG